MAGSFAWGLLVGVLIWGLIGAAVNGAMFDLYPMGWILAALLVVPGIGVWTWFVGRR